MVTRNLDDLERIRRARSDRMDLDRAELAALVTILQSVKGLVRKQRSGAAAILRSLFYA